MEHEYEVGDKVVLNCTKVEFINNVALGERILEENFNKEGIATVVYKEDEDNYLQLEEVVEGSGSCSLDGNELLYIKPYVEPLSIPTEQEVNDLRKSIVLDGVTVYEGGTVIAGSGTKKSKLLWIGDQLVVVREDHTEMAWGIDSLHPVKTRNQLLKETQINSLLNKAAKHDFYPDKDFLEFLQEKGFLKDPE